jgi:DNA-binding CsgD family transcriptional regulator/tetratricopeptide (TPR) repeat protein
MALIEREPYLDALADHLADAVAGTGRLVVVGGEAGVGKTTLLRAFADERAGEVRLAWGSCDGLFTPEPLTPVEEIAAQLDEPFDQAASRSAFFAAILEALAARQTLVIFEDVHWADEATLDFLRYMGRRIDRTGSLVVASYRDDEVGPRHPLRAVLGDVGLRRRIALPPLTQDGVRLLAGDSELDPTELFRETGGNPFFVTEVLAAGGTGVPSSVRDAVLARAARLDAAAREALEAAAVAGTPVEVPLLERVLPEAPGGLSDCLAAGVLQADDGHVGFRHELARRAVEEAIDPLRRAQLHRQVLEALEASGAADDARLAHHAEAAGDAESVLRYARAAAEHAAELGAHRESAEQYARCLRFAGDLAPESVAELLERRSRECSLTLQVEEALTAGLAALEQYRTLGNRLKEGELLSWSARLLYWAARHDEAEDAAHEAVQVLEELPPGRELALAYAQMAAQRVVSLDDQGVIAWGERGRDLAERLGEHQIVVSASTAIGSAEAMRGHGSGALEKALELAESHGADDQVARVYSALVFNSVRNKNWPDADRWLEEGLAYSEERDLDDHRNYLLAWRAEASLDRGRWNDAAVAAQTALEHPHAILHRAWSLLVLGALRARRGDPGVWPLLDEALGLVQDTPAQRQVPLQLVRTEAAFLAGDPARATVEIGSLHPVGLTDRWIAGSLAVWRRRLGWRPEETGAVPRPYALELAGDYADAAAAWERLECPYNAAWVLTLSENEDDLRRSHEALLALGARPAAAIVARRLHERGARGLARGPRSETRGHPAGLTTRELDVLDLVAEGLTNGEIATRLVISEKTVGHHVSAILRKLGVGSRYEAAKLAVEDRELARPR